MKIFYVSKNGDVEQSARKDFKDLADFFRYLGPSVTILEDTRQVAIREGTFGNNLAHAFYTFKGYHVKFI